MAENENDLQTLFNTKEGPLAKTGSNNKGWRDRYFRLKEGKLYYYKSEKDQTVLGYIDLRDCTKVTRANGKKGHGFDIHVPGRVYNLSCKTENEVEEWTASIDVSLALARSVYGDIDRRSGSILERTRQRLDSCNSLDLEQSLSFDNQSNRKSEPDFNSLLEAEVQALNTKSSQLEQELKTTQSQRDQLHRKVQEMKADHEESVKQYKEEVLVLENKIESLEKAKSSLETVNDSLRVQVQEREESMNNFEQQLSEEIRELEEENKTLQEDIEKLKEKQAEINELNEQLKKSNTDLQGRLRKATVDFEEERNELKDETSQLLRKLKETQKSVQLEIGNCENEREQRLRAEEQLKQSADLCHKLEATERERDRLKALLASLQQTQQSDNMSTLEELKAERLQLQVELENLRNSMNTQIESVKGDCDKEKSEITERMIALEKDQSSALRTLESKGAELDKANEQIAELKDTVKTLEDSNSLLKIEKEKAVSDLIAIKKNMKERERRYNSDEENMSPLPKDAKLIEAESRAEMATKLLREIQAERDLLKAQVKKQPSPKHADEAQAQINDLSSPLRIPSTEFKTKSQPTVAMSNIGDLPPPKPKLPSREILDRLVV